MMRARIGALALAFGVCAMGWSGMPARSVPRGPATAAALSREVAGPRATIVLQKSDGGICAFPVYDEATDSWRCSEGLPGGGGGGSSTGCNGEKRICAFTQNGEPYEVDYFYTAGRDYCLVYSTLDGCEPVSGYVDCALVCAASHF
ncbi:MAG TPA: hypothetical protein VFM16_07640 [Holophagaceae bacterium]|nr:hypothetical protein [Holophagaceae bacterium]